MICRGGNGRVLPSRLEKPRSSKNAQTRLGRKGPYIGALLQKKDRGKVNEFSPHAEVEVCFKNNDVTCYGAISIKRCYLKKRVTL